MTARSELSHNLLRGHSCRSERLKTCALVAEITDNGLRYRGHGIAESRGSRKVRIVRGWDECRAGDRTNDIAGGPQRYRLRVRFTKRVACVNTGRDSHGG